MDEAYEYKKAKNYLFDKLSKRVKRPVLYKHINDLTEDYLEKKKILLDSSISELPTSTQIKRWFVREPESVQVKLNNGKYEDIIYVDIDPFCLKDKIASEIYKNLYDWKWSSSDPYNFHPVVQEILDIYKKFKRVHREDVKDQMRTTLYKYGIVGCIRICNLAWTPFFCQMELEKICQHFFIVLEILSKAQAKKMNLKNVEKQIYIFDAFGLKEIDDIKLR
jgi:hypothetical protein